MLIQLGPDEAQKLADTCSALGMEELLGQLCEECGELVQAVQKVRRALKGTTPVCLDDAIKHLTEECADVALCIDTMAVEGLVNMAGVQFIGKYKNNRWHDRVVK